MDQQPQPVRAAIALAITLVVAAACSTTGSGASSSSPSSDPSGAPSTAPSSAPTAVAPSGRPSMVPVELPSGMPTGVPGELPPPDVLEPAVQAAAEHAGVDPSEVTVVQASQVTWPNSALGCPQPGSVYTQALVSGWWIILEAGGETVDVRATNQGNAKVCEDFGPAGG